jgi:hypothetical protein
MKTIKLTRSKLCKCYCNEHKGDDNNTYWYNRRTKIVYSTDCHNKNPKKAIGKFIVGGEIIIQDNTEG